MQREPITLAHQQELNRRFTALGLGLSEYSFANAYLFRERHQYEVIIGQSLYIQGIHRDRASYLLVTEPVQNLATAELFQLLCQVDYLYPIPLSWALCFPSDTFEISSSEGDFDYAYTLDKMRHYPGRKLSTKRNLVRQFLNLYSYESKPLTKELMPEADQILKKWEEDLKVYDQADAVACREAFQVWDHLENVTGRIYFVDRIPVGFIIGGPLGNCSHVIHFVKADKNYKGIYPFIYQDYAQHLNDDIEYINLEQDLGYPKLVQAKHSYVPDCLCTKLRVALLPSLKEQLYGKTSLTLPILSEKVTIGQPCC